MGRQPPVATGSYRPKADLHVGKCLSPVNGIFKDFAIRDGTRAFITGMLLWGTLIALNDGERPVLGVMSQPFTRESFVGTPDGAWLDGRPLKTRARPQVEQAILMSTSPELFTIPARRAALDDLSGKSRMTRFGGDCYADSTIDKGSPASMLAGP